MRRIRTGDEDPEFDALCDEWEYQHELAEREACCRAYADSPLCEVHGQYADEREAKMGPEVPRGFVVLGGKGRTR